MADIIAFRKQTPADKHRGKTLCKNGFHHWGLVKDTRFDSKQGRLVTVHRCRRCGMEKISGT